MTARTPRHSPPGATLTARTLSRRSAAVKD
jgi:hypothetical protein